MKSTKAKNRGMVSGSWWALLRKPDALPVLFSSRSDAKDNRDYDEYLVQVLVRPVLARDLLRGKRALLDRQRPQRQRIEIVNADSLRAALAEVQPKLQRRLRRALAEEMQPKPKKARPRRRS